MAKDHLRLAEPNEKAPEPEIPTVPKTVLEAAESGDRLAEMQAMRRVIARALDNELTSPRDLAALSRRQIELSREIDALRRQKAEEDAEDDVAADEEWSEEAI